ncbi:hypothetical protein ASF60_18020 [Methylobacterium sp. Leaf113]|uniref:hypothetical protein n=1 Tax=Methylobacterium sp. Leaf113 TaxID=1736259 RepID=UPI0006FB5481|nr:hypothetical protein [Methylobacterium sp. Leaf113]KQP91342.1 hypothetical protein ASF60_18020 [Methylobacterium sp. Leaf113]
MPESALFQGEYSEANGQINRTFLLAETFDLIDARAKMEQLKRAVEWMREAAAKVCEEEVSVLAPQAACEWGVITSTEESRRVQKLCDAIRALPLPLSDDSSAREGAQRVVLVEGTSNTLSVDRL